MAYTRTPFKSYVRGLTAITATSLTVTGRTTSAGFSSSIDGDATTPAFNWSGDTDNGMYRGGANDLRLGSAGSIAMSSTSGGVSFYNHTFVASGNLGITSGYLQLAEIAAPGAGAADTVRIYAVVDGGSKTDLVGIFQTGAAQVAAQEP
jgi:hypothetical protein